MKNLFPVLLLLFITTAALGQSTWPSQPAQSNTSTKNIFRGGVQAKKGLINGVYADTTAANDDTSYISHDPAAQIFTTSDEKFWIRNANASGWLSIAIGNIFPGIDSITVNGSTICSWKQGTPTCYLISTSPSGTFTNIDSITVSTAAVCQWSAGQATCYSIIGNGVDSNTISADSFCQWFPPDIEPTPLSQCYPVTGNVLVSGNIDSTVIGNGTLCYYANGSPSGICLTINNVGAFFDNVSLSSDSLTYNFYSNGTLIATLPTFYTAIGAQAPLYIRDSVAIGALWWYIDTKALLGGNQTAVVYVGPNGQYKTDSMQFNYSENETSLRIGNTQSPETYSSIMLNSGRASIYGHFGGAIFNVGSGTGGGGTYDESKIFQFQNRGNNYLQIGSTSDVSHYFRLQPNVGLMLDGLVNNSTDDSVLTIDYITKKVKMKDFGSGWSTTGNTGTNPATNFIGTTDAVPLYFRVNNDTIVKLGTNYNVAMGGSTTASGAYSTAMGVNTIASGAYSTAMGVNTIASGIASTAMGTATASGYLSTAMGAATASANYSTAMGLGNTASGNTSTAMGASTTASGYLSTAMGESTIASGYASTAMGTSTTAIGDYSTAMGTSTTAIGDYSTAMGRGTIMKNGDALVIGRFNDTTTQTNDDSIILFQIGSGSYSGSYRRNLLTATVNGVGIGTTTPDSTLTVVGGLKFDLPSKGNGKVLTSDANGAATWQTSTTGSNVGDSLTHLYLNKWDINGTAVTAGSSYLGTSNNVSLRIRTNNTEVAVFDSVGKVGINKSDPHAFLDISGQNSNNYVRMLSGNSGENYNYVEWGLTDNSIDEFGTMVFNASPEEGISTTITRGSGSTEINQFFDRINILNNGSTAYSITNGKHLFNLNNEYSDAFRIYASSSGVDLLRINNDTLRLLIDEDNTSLKVGIGNNSPTEKLDVTGNIKSSGSIANNNGVIKPYKSYVALLTQTGTSAPTATVLENNLGGTVVWTRTNPGQYRATLTDAFNTAKTIVFLTAGTDQLSVDETHTGISRFDNATNDDYIIIQTGDFSSFNEDNLLNNSAIEIRVYD